MPEFLYIFGFETPLQRRTNAPFTGRDGEDSQSVLIDAPDSDAALAWGDRIAQRFVAILHGEPEVDWRIEGYASFIEPDIGSVPNLRVRIGEYPDFKPWLEKARG